MFIYTAVPMVWMLLPRSSRGSRPCSSRRSGGRPSRRWRAITSCSIRRTASGRTSCVSSGTASSSRPATTILGGHRGGARGLRLLALRLPGPEVPVLLRAAPEHVPGGDLPRPALHPDALPGPGEHARLADPHLSHLRPAARDLAAQGLLRQHPDPARAGGAHRRRDAVPGLRADRDAALGAGHHRHRDLLLHRRLERVHLRLHVPHQERPADAAGRHPALLLGEHDGLARA